MMTSIRGVFALLLSLVLLQMASSFTAVSSPSSASQSFASFAKSSVALQALKNEHSENSSTRKVTLMDALPQFMAAGVIALSTLTAPLSSVAQADSRVVGEIQGSGLVFKVSIATNFA
jgi:hypothetical protein